MGERSSIDSMDFEDTDVDKFLIAFMAEKVAMDKDLHYEFESLRLVKNTEPLDAEIIGDIWFDWEDWKIHGYWYPTFCKFLNILQKCGLRGEVHMTYSDGSMYMIHFDDDEVYAEIRGDYEKCEITDTGIE